MCNDTIKNTFGDIIRVTDSFHDNPINYTLYDKEALVALNNRSAERAK